MTGTVFDIQKFSIFDGPGIRTNVFFKGCNLRCKWCHNPESQKAFPQLMFYKDKCKACGKCTEICQNTFKSECKACGKCAGVCKNGARKISGYTTEADEIVKAVLRDREFFKTSGGGVTLSGGEPLLQIDFALEILKKCKENGINTAIETAGNVDFAKIEKIMPYTDLFLYDIKCMDSVLHKELTGADNSLILENAEKLKQSGKDIIFRIPVIPGLNDGEVQKVKEFANGFTLELLAYHKTGCGKYEALNTDYEIPDIEPPTKEFMTELAAKNGAVYKPTGI